ncbi:hypothetical protein AABM38_24070 [Heyndrickxia sp. MSNUG]|uniref:hypothetical protein n=1 Tax=Heyndrickxia sp. MSNUG TaxID=3136677 RepID=UPI003C2B1670
MQRFQSESDSHSDRFGEVAEIPVSIKLSFGQVYLNCFDSSQNQTLVWTGLVKLQRFQSESSHHLDRFGEVAEIAVRIKLSFGQVYLNCFDCW